MGRAALGEQARAGREKGWAAPGRAGRKEVGAAWAVRGLGLGQFGLMGWFQGFLPFLFLFLFYF